MNLSHILNNIPINKRVSKMYAIVIFLKVLELLNIHSNLKLIFRKKKYMKEQYFILGVLTQTAQRN